MTFVSLGDQLIGEGSVINWYNGVATPRTVFLFEGPHPDLRLDYSEAEREARKRQVGKAYRIWRSKRYQTVTYFMARSGEWNADARRVGTKGSLLLMGFAR